jgi:O-methyltransferase
MRFILDLVEEQPHEYFKRFAAALVRLGRAEVQMQPELLDVLQRSTASDVAMLAGLMKAFNSRNPLVKVSFAFDDLNRAFGVQSSYPFWAKEHMLRGYMTSREQASNLYHLLRSVVVSHVAGDVVELGCHEGVTAVVLQKTLDEHASDKRLHVFDSFQGLPAPGTEDLRDGVPATEAGALAVGEDRLRRTFEKYGARLPEIHKGWFSDTLAAGLPSAIAFAHLDGDLYASTKVSLEHVYPRLSRGAVVVVDDYHDPALLPSTWSLFPGVKQACDEFLADKPEKMQPLLAGDECHACFAKA